MGIALRQFFSFPGLNRIASLPYRQFIAVRICHSPFRRPNADQSSVGHRCGRDSDAIDRLILVIFQYEHAAQTRLVTLTESQITIVNTTDQSRDSC